MYHPDGTPRARRYAAVGFECDSDEAYWQHYTTRHNTAKYAEVRQQLEHTINRSAPSKSCSP